MLLNYDVFFTTFNEGIIVGKKLVEIKFANIIFLAKVSRVCIFKCILAAFQVLQILVIHKTVLCLSLSQLFLICL